MLSYLSYTAEMIYILNGIQQVFSYNLAERASAVEQHSLKEINFRKY